MIILLLSQEHPSSHPSSFLESYVPHVVGWHYHGGGCETYLGQSGQGPTVLGAAPGEESFPLPKF